MGQHVGGARHEQDVVHDAGDVPKLPPVDDHEGEVVDQIPEEHAGEDIRDVGVADDGGRGGEVEGVAEAEEDAWRCFLREERA